MERPTELESLKLILEGTSHETGRQFFRALVKALAEVLGTTGAWATHLDPGGERLDAYALWLDGEWVDGYSYAIAGTPCEAVINECRSVHVPDRVVEVYPDDPDLEEFDALSYLGVPLVDHEGAVIGNLAVMDRKRMPENPRGLAIIEIFASRAAAEVSRIRAEDALLCSERQLNGLVNSALDAILQLDSDLVIVRANPAAENVFRAQKDALTGRSFAEHLSDDSAQKFRRYLAAVDSGTSRSTWISGGLEAIRVGGAPFPAEASLARFSAGDDRFLTVILRDVNERIQAEQEIASLREEAESLRDEIRAMEGSGEILGKAPCLLAMLEEIERVGPTDASVLIQGETGTGKELVARAIHAASKRKDRTLVRVNCGAIPSTLIESELFGHEKGSFTGATARRQGRFAAADKATIFLDEIGELPLDLQVKLLRVLQEGEFEPVGSSQTRKVDVRVIAATNRDLNEEVAAGRFREDLFYRLNVFPMRVPPLRERREDIPVLAEAFARRVSAKLGRRIDPLSADDLAVLQASDWPGNVRELQNVIERAAIISRDRRLELDRAMPSSPTTRHRAVESPGGEPAETREDLDADARILSQEELEDAERRNTIRALQHCGWKVSGRGGAAELLGVKPSTLASRMRALGITRP